MSLLQNEEATRLTLLDDVIQGRSALPGQDPSLRHSRLSHLRTSAQRSSRQHRRGTGDQSAVPSRHTLQAEQLDIAEASNRLTLPD